MNYELVLGKICGLFDEDGVGHVLASSALWGNMILDKNVPFFLFSLLERIEMGITKRAP